MRTDIEERKEDIENWINLNQSKAFICRELKCKPETLNFWLDKLNLNYDGNQGRKGIYDNPKNRTASEYAELPSCRSGVLKKKMIKEGLIEDICDECKTPNIWNGKPITLELDHIDGDRFNNDFKNLRVLCPNCHSQTPTFRRKKENNISLLEPNNEEMKAHRERIRKETEAKWEKLGFLEGLSGHLREDIAGLFEAQASQLITDPKDDKKT